MNVATTVRTPHRRQWVPRPLEAVLECLEHPKNLALTPWLGSRLRTLRSLAMREGLGAGAAASRR